MREKARGNDNNLSYVPSERKEEIKSGTSGYGSFVVPYFQPPTSTTDCLHTHLQYTVVSLNGAYFVGQQQNINSPSGPRTVYFSTSPRLWEPETNAIQNMG